MKILHVILSLDPAAGGPPMVAARLAAAQAGLGHSARIAGYEAPAARQRIDAAMKTILGIDHVNIIDLPAPGRLDRLFAGNTAKHLEPHIRDADIVHLHGVWDPILFAAAKVARRLSRPYVVTPHGMLDPWSLAQKETKKKIALALGYRRMLNDAAFIHFINLDERRLTEPLHLTSAGHVVHNGVFLEEIDPLPPRGQFRAEHPEFAEKTLIFFLSRLHFKKGLDILADAFAIVLREFPEARLVVAGPDDGARADFEKQIRDLHISTSVYLVGPIYGEKKMAALRDCDCFCLPSRQEGFSIAILEALASEAPVVISPDCHFPEVKESNAGIIAALNAPATAQALLTILRDPDAARRMGQSGRNLVVTRFTWPQSARQLIAHYQAAIGV
jgi:glycosyltransferase involved in cell wall biosynthesis